MAGRNRWKTPGKVWDLMKPLAREHRREPTPAEAAVWEMVRRKRLHGYQFRRQHPIASYIADFYCARASLVVEIDGSSHRGREEADRNRDEAIRTLGIRVIRFTNEEVLADPESVRARILKALP